MDIKEINRQWAIRISEKRNYYRKQMDEEGINGLNYDYYRGKWAGITDLLASEFSPKLLSEINNTILTD